MERTRRLLPAFESAALLVVIMFMGSLVLWVGVPVAWLWVGSQVQGSSTMAAAIGAMMIGMLVTIAVLIALLGWLNRKHVELQEARGANLPQNATTALEHVMVASAVVAVVGFFVWFFGFSGSSPIPLNISY
jgi:uncharacterized membrane protein YidH (DUF202 family)